MPPGLPTAESGRELYNGNISNATYAIGKIENGKPAGYTYRYDQLNRLTAMDRHSIIKSYGWDNNSIIDEYKERISYDANGNILTYLRNKSLANHAAMDMDNLTYNYNLDSHGRLVNNRLRHVRDQVVMHGTDIFDQQNDNYRYDKTGNLAGDRQEGIEKIDWTVYGKIATITKKTGVTIHYGYDAGGNRINKQVENNGLVTNTHYVRDAQGNVLGVYEYKANTAGALTHSEWTEQHLYGSSRLGMLTPKWDISNHLDNDAYQPNAEDHTQDIGKRIYELTNHLGNVMATVSDKRIGHDNGSGTIDYFEADVVSANDYYPSG